MTAPDTHRCSCGRPLPSEEHLCERCTDRLGDDLLEVASRFVQLSARPSQQPGRYDRGRSGAPGSRPPARLGVTALTDFRSGQTEPVLWRGADGKQHQEGERDTPAVVRAVLGWCQTIADERGFAGEPWLPRPIPAPRPAGPAFTMVDHDEMTGAVDWVAAKQAELAAEADARRRRRQRWAPTHVVDEAVAWLCRQDQWIGRWADGPALAEQARKLRNRLRAACGEPNPKPAARCIAQLDDEAGTECGAAVFLPDDAGATAAYLPVVRCTGERRHEYTRSDLTRLALANQHAEQQRETSR